MPSVSIDKTLERIDLVERKLLSAAPVSKVTGEVARELGMTRRQASHYVRAVRRRWEREGASDREAKRDEMRSLLRAGLAQCIGKKKKYKRKDGSEVVQDDPDMMSAARFAELMCRLDGLLEQPEAAGEDGQWRDNALTVLHLHYFGNAPQEAVALPEAGPTPRLPRVIEGEVVRDYEEREDTEETS